MPTTGSHITVILNQTISALVALRRHQEALASGDKALTLKPDEALAWTCRGVALQHLNRHQEAVASFDKALTLRPAYANASKNRRIALRYVGGF